MLLSYAVIQTLLFYLVSGFALYINETTSSLIATTEQGKVQGKTQTDIKGREFLVFLGIPYAKPPIGGLRFKNPQPPEPWQNVRDATKEGQSCYGIQMEFTPKGITTSPKGSEDCLFLNIFTHEIQPIKSDELKPVMVYIHGGGFTCLSSSTSTFGPEFLLTQDIVLVTINYRLGAFGFLSIEDQSIGNAGLKDMVQALKWIKKNIAEFGGNPDSVTIFGESAGGAAVQFLILSPLAKGLFHKGIAQSGSVLNAWTRGQEKNVEKLTEALGSTESDGKKVLEYLQQLSTEKIFEAQTKLGDTIAVNKIRYFSPTVEPKSDEAFLTDDPLKILQSGNFTQVPLIMGYTSQEGFVLPLLGGLGLTVSYTEFVPFFLGYDENSTEYKNTNRKISKFYFGSDVPDQNDLLGHIKVSTDNFFFRGVYSSIKDHAKVSSKPVYFYKVTVETKLNVIKALLNISEKGVSHLDDIAYLFKNALTPSIAPGSPEEVSMERFVKLWTNFARTGNPIPSKDPTLSHAEWKPVVNGQLNYLEIGNELVSGINPEPERMKFWDEIFKEKPGY